MAKSLSIVPSCAMGALSFNYYYFILKELACGHI